MVTITRDLQIALYAYTAAIRNAREEYAAHPTAACHGRDLRKATYTPCDDLAQTDDRYCRRHRRILDKKAAHMRARRKTQ